MDAESGDIILRGPVTLGTLNNDGLLTRGSGRIEIAGTIAGDGSLRHAGAGILVLNSENTYTGDTVLVGGTLGLGNDLSLGSGLLRLTQDSSLFAADADRMIDNDVMLGADLTLQADEDGTSRMLTLSDQSTVTLTGDRQITVTGGSTLQISGEIGESGGPRLLTLDAAEGEIRLSGDNMYSGGTSLAGGRIVTGHENAFGSGVLTIDGPTELVLDDSLSAGGISGSSLLRLTAGRIGRIVKVRPVV